MPALKTILLTCFALSFAMVLATQMPNVSVCQSTDFTGTEKKAAFAFLEKVADIKLDAYNVTGYRSVTTPSFVQESLHPGHVETWLSINLSGGNHELKITMDFIDGKFHRYQVSRPAPETPITNAPVSTNFLDTASGVLERYRLFSNASYCVSCASPLERISKLDQEETIETDKALLKFQPSDENGRVGFLWCYKSNNIPARKKSFSMKFNKNGFLTRLSDWWGIYRIGNVDVNISKETAISTALGLAGNVTETIRAKIESIEATLQFDSSSERGDCYTLYPEWDVNIQYDKAYNNVLGYAVDIWADTGEVSYATGQFYYGLTETTLPANLWILILATLIITPTLLAFFKMYRRPKGFQRKNQNRL